MTPMKKMIVGITVVGKDREGIVAQFTNFVFQNNANVEKVNQNVIKGLFGMYLEVSFTSKINFKQLDSGLQKLGKKLRMEISLSLRSSWVQIPPPAPLILSTVFMAY